MGLPLGLQCRHGGKAQAQGKAQGAARAWAGHWPRAASGHGQFREVKYKHFLFLTCLARGESCEHLEAVHKGSELAGGFSFACGVAPCPQSDAETAARERFWHETRAQRG